MKRAQDIVFAFVLALAALLVVVPGIINIVYQWWRRL